MVRKSATRAADKAEMAKWLFDNSHDLMQVVSPEGVLLQVNRAWSDFTGLSEAELIGRSVFDFCHPDEIEGIRSRAEVARPGDVSEAEVRLRAADGSWRWVAARRQVMDSGAHIGNMRDIHAERADRDEIEEARRTRKMLGASAGIGIWEFDPVANTIWWSDELSDLVGFDPQVVWTPDLFFEHIHPRDRRPTREAMAEAVATGKAVRLEHRIRAGRRWITMRVTVRTERRAGGVFALKGISEDITELAKARDAARRGEQQMRKATPRGPGQRQPIEPRPGGRGGRRLRDRPCARALLVLAGIRADHRPAELQLRRGLRAAISRVPRRRPAARARLVPRPAPRREELRRILRGPDRAAGRRRALGPRLSPPADQPEWPLAEGCRPDPGLRRQQAPGTGPDRGPAGGRGGRRGQGGLPGQHESRDPHAAERGDGRAAPAEVREPQRRRPQPARRGAVLRADAGRVAQRRDRLLEDRGRPAGTGLRARRPGRARRRRRAAAGAAGAGPRACR